MLHTAHVPLVALQKSKPNKTTVHIHMRSESSTYHPSIGDKTLDIRPKWQVTIESVLEKGDSLACTFYNGLVAVHTRHKNNYNESHALKSFKI
jgi:hypothetical protein